MPPSLSGLPGLRRFSCAEDALALSSLVRSEALKSLKALPRKLEWQIGDASAIVTGRVQWDSTTDGNVLISPKAESFDCYRRCKG